MSIKRGSGDMFRQPMQIHSPREWSRRNKGSKYSLLPKLIGNLMVMIHSRTVYDPRPNGWRRVGTKVVTI